MKLGIALLAAAAAIALPAAAQEETKKAIVLSDIQAAQLLIVNNRLDDARLLLEHDLAARPDDSEILSLDAAMAFLSRPMPPA